MSAQPKEKFLHIAFTQLPPLYYTASLALLPLPVNVFLIQNKANHILISLYLFSVYDTKQH
jgi:hypothetical protein